MLYAIGSKKNAQGYRGEVLAGKTMTQKAITVYAGTGMALLVGGSTGRTARSSSYILLFMPTLEHAQNTGRIVAGIAQPIHICAKIGRVSVNCGVMHATGNHLRASQEGTWCSRRVII